LNTSNTKINDFYYKETMETKKSFYASNQNINYEDKIEENLENDTVIINDNVDNAMDLNISRNIKTDDSNQCKII